jgi:cystathionine beta-lyase/cystathionine gamma-synthase
VLIMAITKNASFATKLIHGGEKPDPITGAVAPNLVRSKTFAQQNIGEKGLYEYSRGKNPTRDILENKIAEICDAQFATVFATGLAAEASLFLTLKPGDRILCPHEVYGGTVRLFKNIFAPLASPETLLAYPPTMSHGALTDEERDRLGITKGFFRLSVGFEDTSDIIHALETGFGVL